MSGGNQKKENNKKELKPLTEEDLFMLEEKIEDIYRKMRSVHRWVLYQKIVSATKTIITIAIIVGAVSVFNSYFPIIKARMDMYKNKIDSVVNLLNEPGKGLPIKIEITK